MILTITLNPCIDKTIWVPKNELGRFINASSLTMIAGGKGNNVSRVLKNFGYDTLALNLLGQNEGEIVRQLLEGDGIPYEVVNIEASTREVVTIVEEETNHQTVYFGPAPSVSMAERKLLMETYARLIGKSELVIVSGSSPDKLLDEVVREMIIHANQRGIKTILDARDEALKLGVTAGPFALKPNLAEAEFLFGKRLSTQEELFEALDWLEKYEITINIISLGEEGAIVRYLGHTFLAVPPTVKVVNPIGSGDALIAGLAMAIVDHLDIEQAIRQSIAASVANVTTWKACDFTKEQVLELIPQVKVQELINVQADLSGVAATGSPISLKL